VFNLWFAWCCGSFLADKKMLGPDDIKRPVYKLFYLLIFIGFLYFNLFGDKQGEIFDQFNILVWTAPVLFILSKEDWLRQKQNLWLIRIVAAIGLSSYSLYLLHVPLIYLKNYMVHQYFPARLQLAGEATGIFVIPVIAWYSYKYLEKPFTSYKKKTVGQSA
jgi:peptidoglycan/LPS O-acetylase OafA/YrhL